MKNFIRTTVLFCTLITLVGAGCASDPNQPQTKSQERPPGIAGGSKKRVYSASMEQCRTAGIDAMVALGFKQNKDLPTFVQGKRPHKTGFLSGSGGETIKIWFEPVSDTQTRVYVDTDKDFVGYVAQRVWTDDIIHEMTRALNMSQPQSK
jgi:hypothetical protein